MIPRKKFLTSTTPFCRLSPAPQLRLRQRQEQRQAWKEYSGKEHSFGLCPVGILTVCCAALFAAPIGAMLGMGWARVARLFSLSVVVVVRVGVANFAQREQKFFGELFSQSILKSSPIIELAIFDMILPRPPFNNGNRHD